MSDVVLVSAHGTVEREEDVPAFVLAIRRGRPASPEVVAEVARRLRVIGGSPLLRITNAQANALSGVSGLPVVVGMRLWRPTLDDALERARELGATRIVSLPFAPQSVHVYHAAIRAAADRARARGHAVPNVVEVAPWGSAHGLIEAHRECIDEGLASLAPQARGEAAVVLSAHSLPVHVLASGDPYERDFRAMCDAIIKRCADARVYRVAFQSQGMDGGDWLGPDLPATFAQLAREGHHHVLVAPVGFVADHVETLYDLDVDARAQALGAGFESFARAPCVNLRPKLIEALASLVRAALA